MILKKRPLSLLILIKLLAAVAISPLQAYPPKIEGATEYVYKSVDGVDLKIWVFSPSSSDVNAAPVPAMLFYFGGGWHGGNPEQFTAQSQYLAERGMIGIVADYRVKSRNNVQAKSCVEDAYDAFKYITTHAKKLGIDPSRVGVGGGSAGGHLAACVGTVHASKDRGPYAMALYNPVTTLAPIDFNKNPSLGTSEDHATQNQALEAKQGQLRHRLGVEPATLSPFHNIQKATPPALILHGTHDKTVPYESAVLFHKQLKAKGISSTLKTYKSAGHGFFNREPYRTQTNAALEQFLKGLGWLQ